MTRTTIILETLGLATFALVGAIFVGCEEAETHWQCCTDGPTCSCSWTEHDTCDNGAEAVLACTLNDLPDAICCASGNDMEATCFCSNLDDCGSDREVDSCTDPPPDGPGGGGDGGSSPGGCEKKEPGTEFAPCEDDGDCFSGFCKESCSPAACCQHPNTSAILDGRGYTCESDEDCATVAPDFVARGGSAICHYDSVNGVSNGCSFECQ